MEVAAWLALGAVIGVLVWQERRHARALGGLSELLASLHDDSTHQELAAHVPPTAPERFVTANEHLELVARVDLLVLAVDAGITHVERVEKRVAATIRRARKEFTDAGFEHAGLDAEAAELQLVDGDGGEEDSVPPMPTDVEGTPSSIPGVTAEQLARFRGR